MCKIHTYNHFIYLLIFIIYSMYMDQISTSNVTENQNHHLKYVFCVFNPKVLAFLCVIKHIVLE